MADLERSSRDDVLSIGTRLEFLLGSKTLETRTKISKVKTNLTCRF